MLVGARCDMRLPAMMGGERECSAKVIATSLCTVSVPLQSSKEIYFIYQKAVCGHHLALSGLNARRHIVKRRTGHGRISLASMCGVVDHRHCHSCHWKLAIARQQSCAKSRCSKLPKR